MTTTESVQAIADFMADAEKRAWLNLKGSRDLRADFKTISDDGSAPVLMTSKYHAELVAMTAAHSAQLLDLHHRMTEDAKMRGIDIPPATPTEGEVGVLGGGDR